MAEEVIVINKLVYLTYSIIDQAGKVFEQYDMPIGYVQGANSGLFAKVERALEGRKVGDRVEVSLDPAGGFGAHDPDLSFTDDIENVPPEFRYVGAEVEFTNDKNESMKFWVSHIADGKLTVDANHPLAGQTVTFVVNVVSIQDATPDEIATGLPADADNDAGNEIWTDSIKSFFSRLLP